MPLGQKWARFWFIILQILNIPEEANIKTLLLRKSINFFLYWLLKQQTIKDVFFWRTKRINFLHEDY